MLPSLDVFEIIHNRRSIRKFTDQSVTEEDLKKILEAGFRAPFAAQLCSVVYTRKPEVMDKLRRLGVYSTTKVLMVFLIDVHRLEKIMYQRGHKYDQDDGMTLWIGIQDVSLVIENLILAAEALGMGSVLLGNAPLNADLISKVLKIPKRVYPVVGLCLGYPDPSEETEIRPRFPLKHSAFEDVYHDLSESEIQEAMQVMDEGYLAQNYYVKLGAKIPLRRVKDEISLEEYSWCEHISRKYCQGRWTEETLATIIGRYGFRDL